MNRRQLGLHRAKLADLLVLLVLLCLTALYGIDTVRASTHILNLILVLPAAIVVAVLCAAQFVIDIVHVSEAPPPREPVRQVLPVMLLFAAYVVSLEWLGFDVGTFAFLCAFLWLHGERRLRWLFAYSICFAAVTTLFFAYMLPYPMPMLILDTAY
jgi:hypothetical protein